MREGELGLNEAPPIVDPYLSDTVAAVQRGRNFLDSEDGVETVDLDVVYRPGFAKGQLVEVHDALQGEVWRGKIAGISYTIDTVILVSLRIVRKPG